MYLIMVQGELRVEFRQQPTGCIKVNGGKWVDVPDKFRRGTIEVTDSRIFMWRGLIKYEYLYLSNMWVPAGKLDRFLSLFYTELVKYE